MLLFQHKIFITVVIIVLIKDKTLVNKKIFYNVDKLLTGDVYIFFYKISIYELYFKVDGFLTSDKQKLEEIKTLVFKKDEYTTGKRVLAVLQVCSIFVL
jgi:hypothetical protein